MKQRDEKLYDNPEFLIDKNVCDLYKSKSTGICLDEIQSDFQKKL